MSNYGPSLTALKLYKKISSKGSTYYVGRMGMVKVALLKSDETAENGDEIWNLVYQQAADKPRQDGKPSREVRAKANEPLRSPTTSSRSTPNDVIPF